MPRRHPGLLTLREEEIARLVAEGLSNPQVAYRLGVSEHRVRNALASIYVKTKTANRVQLAHWVWQRSELGDARGPGRPDRPRPSP